MMNADLRIILFIIAAITIFISLCLMMIERAHRSYLQKLKLKSRALVSRFDRIKNSIVMKIDKRRLLSFGAGVALGLGVALSEPVSSWDTGIRLLVILLFTFLGYRFPALQDESAQKKRQAEIETDFPGVLDILIIMLDAGSTFDDALTRFLDERYFRGRHIKRELARLAAELQLTPNRQAAFHKFSFSSQSQNLKLFSSVLIQSEIYGTPISKGLRGLALEMRQKQFSEVEAKSGALGPKLAIPMTLFFLPLIFIIVLAPTLIRAFKLS